MPKPVEICLEELDRSHEDDCFVRCVALPGGEPGLALDREGLIRWMPEGLEAHGLWVSADDRLMLERTEGAGPITVERGSRTLVAPPGQPVALLDQDLLLVGSRRLRVHLHGVAGEVTAPERLSVSALGKVARAAAMATLALGGAATVAAAQPVTGGSGRAPDLAEPPPIEVRVRPPKPAPPPRKKVHCNITSQKAGPKGKLILQATCPSGEKLHVGLYGSILDPATGDAIKDGLVRITELKGEKIVTEAQDLKRPVRAKTILFRVHDW